VKSFRYERPATLDAAVKALAEGPALLKASGIDVLDRLKERVDEPDRVVTLVDVPGFDAIALGPDGTLRIGALATLAAIAASADVRKAAPALAHAAEEAASPQLRNRATLGGNLAQHTRCGYYRLKSFPCFKRGDPFCPVRSPGAVQENAGIFDAEACACAHPSSLAPALGASGAVVVVRDAKGERRLPLADLYAPPAQGKASDTTLGPGDVITSVELAAAERPARSAFYEVRQRASFDWALVSCAVGFDGGESAVKRARVWLGAVAPYPWRAAGAEKALVGKAFSPAVAAAAADAAVEGAKPLPGTAYKVDLVKVAVRRALLAAWERR
jgi:xanthine dehydrogenase YagS FAD-binding subunit